MDKGKNPLSCGELELMIRIERVLLVIARKEKSRCERGEVLGCQQLGTNWDLPQQWEIEKSTVQLRKEH